MKAINYFNKRTIYSMICSLILVIFTTLTIINSSIVEHYTREKEKSELYIEWYKLMIDEPHKMLDIKQETISDFSIKTKYIFYTSKEQVVDKYTKLLKNNDWISEKDFNGYRFKKNQFEFYMYFNGKICEIRISKNKFT